MFMFGLHSAVVGVLLALAPGSPRGVPSADEQKAFAEGLRLFEGGDARGAERTWKAGYAAGHDPAFLVRIGEAQEKAGAPKEAVKSYEQYLRESPDAADRADIDARLRRLSPGTTRAKAPDDELPGEMSRPGDQVSSAPGGGAAAATPSSGGTPGDGGGKPAAVGTTSPVGGAHQQVKDDDANEDLHAFVEGEGEGERSHLNVAGWVGAGVTALLLGAAAFYGAKAAEKAGDANRLLLYVDETTGVPQEYAPHARQYEDIVSQGQRDDRVAKGLVIAAGATAVASAVLFILDGRRDGAAGAGTERNERTAARITPNRSHPPVATSMATSVPANRRPAGAPDGARGLKPDVDVGVGMGRGLALGLARGSGGGSGGSGSGSGTPAGCALPPAGGINVSLGLAWRF